MGFSVFVEMLNLQLRTRPGEPVHLRQPYAGIAGRATPVRAGGEQTEPSG
jgi:hypothetical protein